MKTNRELLALTDPALMGAIDKQRRYLLLMYSNKKPCPNCAHASTFFEAAGIDIDALDLTQKNDPPFACPNCKRALVYTVPLLGGWTWRLVPDRVRS